MSNETEEAQASEEAAVWPFEMKPPHKYQRDEYRRIIVEKMHEHSPGTFFRDRAGNLVLVDFDEAGTVRQLSADDLLHITDKIVCHRDGKHGWVDVPRNDRMAIVRGGEFPQFSRVWRCPFLSFDRKLHGDLGSFDPYTQTALRWAPTSKQDVDIMGRLAALQADPDRAVEFVGGVIERLLDFGFVDEPDREAALGLFLLPIVRPFIQGPTPWHLISAAEPRSGKTYLAQTAALIALGGKLAPVRNITGSQSQEGDYQVGGWFKESPSFLLIDNIPTAATLDNPTFLTLLTATPESGTFLRAVKDAGGKVDTAVVWVATGNQIDASEETARRLQPIRLRKRPISEIANTRLHEYVIENIVDVTVSLLWYVWRWVEAGCPDGKKTLPSFDAWARTIGGILETNGFEHFLDYRPVPNEKAEMLEAIAYWGDARRSATDFLRLLEERGLHTLRAAAIGRDARNQRAEVTAAGRYLRRHANERTEFGEWRIECRDARNSMVYYPVPVED